MAAGALDGPFLEEKHDGRHIRITAPRSQESERVRRIALVLCVLLVSSLQSCGLAFMRQSMAGETTLSAPPSGKSLVNFHRPSGFGGAADFRIFDRENLIGNVAGGCLFQYVCDPGEHVFVGTSQSTSVVRADLAADKVYDIVINVGMGFIRADYQEPREAQRAQQLGGSGEADDLRRRREESELRGQSPRPHPHRTPRLPRGRKT